MKCGTEACLAHAAGLRAPGREDKVHTDAVKLMVKLADCKVNGSFSMFLKSSGQKCFTRGWHAG